MLSIPKITTQIATKSVFVRQISCTTVRKLDQKWREKNGLPSNPNSYGPLTNLPDYTYLDGRPTPLGSNQKKRLLYQREIAAKIVEYNSELKFAKERYVRIQKEKVEEKERIMQSKLKPKGHLLLQALKVKK